MTNIPQGLLQDFGGKHIEANFKGGQSHIKYRESQFPRGGVKAPPAPPPPEINPVPLDKINIKLLVLTTL
jgi:hypothetical protein